MRLTIPFAFLMGSFAAAASSFQHPQINVEATHSDSKNQADTLYSSGKQVINEDGPRLSNLPFNFTLIAHIALGIHKSKLPFGFVDLTMKDGFNRGELGYETEFALLNGKLRNGNRALAWHVAKILPPWTSLWSFNEEDLHKYFDFVAVPHLSGEKEHYFLEFISSGKLTSVTQIYFVYSISTVLISDSFLKEVSFGVVNFNQGEPVFIGPVKCKLVTSIHTYPIRLSHHYANLFADITFLKAQGVRIVLEIKEVANDDINTDFAEELL